MKLNGWKRIGIVASVIYILDTGIYTFFCVNDSTIKQASQQTPSCEEANGMRGSAECDKRSTDYLAEHNSDARIAALSAALIPAGLSADFIFS